MGKVSEAPAEACSKVWWCSSSDMVVILSRGYYIEQRRGATDRVGTRVAKFFLGEGEGSGWVLYLGGLDGKIVKTGKTRKPAEIGLTGLVHLSFLSLSARTAAKWDENGKQLYIGPG
jgi:hypothetical protein